VETAFARARHRPVFARHHVNQSTFARLLLRDSRRIEHGPGSEAKAAVDLLRVDPSRGTQVPAAVESEPTIFRPVLAEPAATMTLCAGERRSAGDDLPASGAVRTVRIPTCRFEVERSTSSWNGRYLAPGVRDAHRTGPFWRLVIARRAIRRDAYPQPPQGTGASACDWPARQHRGARSCPGLPSWQPEWRSARAGVRRWSVVFMLLVGVTATDPGVSSDSLKMLTSVAARLLHSGTTSADVDPLVALTGVPPPSEPSLTGLRAQTRRREMRKPHPLSSD